MNDVVRDVTVRSVVVPLRRPLATKVGDFSRWPLLLIDVTTEQGITGRGYLAPYLTRAAAALRPAVGDEVALVADYNQGLSLDQALERGRALDGEGLTWIEEPLRYDDLDGHARLAADLATPVMLGENFYGPRALYEAVRARACDLVMPDLMRIGGGAGWAGGAAAAPRAGVPLPSHLLPAAAPHPPPA